MLKINDLAAFYFHQGTNSRAYEYLGCHVSVEPDKFIYSFRVWAPNAIEVSLVSDFLGWESGLALSKISEKGIWELQYVSAASLEGSAYKYKICSRAGTHLKGDPYARASRGGADGASVVCHETTFKWEDAAWLRYRAKTMVCKRNEFLPTPINIYEVHLGSFLRHDDNSYLSYRELAETLPSYVKAMGYTHVELLPIAEYPYDGSWGYQVGAFYAPTSRYGTGDDFKYFVNAFHKIGVGVIIDWVPAHFPKDEWGLFEFDGSPLYEYQGADRQESETWGTRFFDLGREEVQSFLVSNALYYVREFHVDGLRVDAVASMLYLDYDRSPGAWSPNSNGGRESLEAIAFFKKLNSVLLGEFADVLMIAEESGSFGGITHPVSEGGLGFSLKWNMGWANDFYDYLMTDPLFRKHKHKALNFPLMYAFNENYVLPVSHDEVVHGKLSLIDKMYGSYEDKFRQMRCAFLLMMTYPGKKLLFMGTEFAQFREWDFSSSLEWFMLDYPNHRAMREYVAALNGFYLKNRELYECDFSPRGFKWILPDESEKNIVAYRRRAISGKELVVAINFSGSEQTIELPLRAYDKLLTVFSTCTELDGQELPIEKSKRSRYVSLRLPAFSGAVFKEKKDEKTIKL